ncbi:pentapeptide repeat-containing protein [Shewanella sp. JM162201]|uniref:Pentapeptide repeat-containing protein n=1 Tax=Shewanella jiangmenensis TaxID=2837387 RepID=A0ABS5UYF8_9GAMM|nr:pentapeptide repeat-containing protein [Shewanella jiangmenensis]
MLTFCHCCDFSRCEFSRCEFSRCDFSRRDSHHWCKAP